MTVNSIYSDLPLPLSIGRSVALSGIPSRVFPGVGERIQLRGICLSSNRHSRLQLIIAGMSDAVTSTFNVSHLRLAL